jgi:peptidoglycan/xylan/chitin deacetylase (PgdA/CDA1 family)
MKRLLKGALQRAVAAAAPLSWKLQSRPRLLILMYHRVLPATDPARRLEQPGMYVSPSTLDMHLHVLKEHFELVHLDDWLRAAARGEALPRLACALTFDDGWRDNFDHAFPVLRRHSAPATIFVVSTLTNTYQEFWPNRLARLIAAGDGTAAMPAELADVLAPVLARRRTQHALGPEDLDLAIRLAKDLNEAHIVRLLDEAQHHSVAATPERTVMNEDELREMGRSGLVRYGSHTRSHFRCLETASREVLEAEIGRSREEIRASVGQSVDLFCYPNGDTTPLAAEIVSRHYKGAVTTARGWHRPDRNRFLIPRVGVHEDISDRPATFLARISNWI